MDDFEKELKIGFLDEAAQCVSEVEQCYLLLETDPQDTKTLDKIFRLAHNLKGSSKAVGFDELGAFTHDLESLLLKLKNGDLKVTRGIVSLLLRCNDFICTAIDSYKQDFGARLQASDLVAEIQKYMSGSVEEEEAVEPNLTEELVAEIPDAVLFEDGVLANATINETIATPLEDSLPSFNTSPDPELAMHTEIPPERPPKVDFDLQAHRSEMPTEISEASKSLAEVPPQQVAATVVAPATTIPIATAATQTPLPPASRGKQGTAQTDESIRVSLARLEKLQNFVGEMVILQAVLREQALQVDSHLLRKTVHQLGKVAKEVQDVSMGLRMVPVKPTFQKMQRIVRDVASALGKNINFVISGEDTELDKTVLERINDPLVHLIRNSVDHGIENVEKRRLAGKALEGKVQLKAYHQSGKLVLEISDDGGGLDPEKLKAVAIQRGVLKPGVQLTDKEAQNLIFAPGFSTKSEVTDISGRGVGMDVVRTNINELGGEIQISSVVGQGTVFKILLPLTLAIVEAMVVRVGESRFVIPLAMVHESLKPKPDEVKNTTGLGEILLLRGESLPLYRLHSLLNMKMPEIKDSREKHQAHAQSTVVVVRAGETPFGLALDEIIGQYQIVIKQLGPEIQNVNGISGCSILGDGRPALILEPTDLIKRGSKSEPSRKAA